LSSCWARAFGKGDIDTDAIIIPPRWIQAVRESYVDDGIATIMHCEPGEPNFDPAAALTNRLDVLPLHTEIKAPTSTFSYWADRVIDQIATECEATYTCIGHSWRLLDIIADETIFYYQSVDICHPLPPRDVTTAVTAPTPEEKTFLYGGGRRFRAPACVRRLRRSCM